jgi:hypothetical protein
MSNPVPRWLYALNIVILAILTFKVWACLASPSSLFGADTWTPAATAGLRELAGRNLAMIAVSLAAFVRPRLFFPAVLAMGFVRETVDMVLVPVNAGVSPATIGQAASFLLFLGAYAVGWRQLARPATS